MRNYRFLTLISVVICSILAYGCRTTAADYSANLFYPDPYVPDDDTALLLHLDGELRDAAGKVLSIDMEGGAWTDDGVISGALLCDGSQKIVIPPMPELADGFTVEAWLRIDELTEDFTTWNLAEWPGLFQVGFEMRPGAAPRPRMEVITPEGTFLRRSGSSIPMGWWVHVAFVYDPEPESAANMAAAIHGSPVGLRRGLTEKVEGRPQPSDAPIVLFEGIVGAVDEFRISTRPRALMERVRKQVQGRRFRAIVPPENEELIYPWLSGRRGDYVPFSADMVTPPPPPGWSSDKVWPLAVQVVPTFHSIGIYVPYLYDENSNSVCRVRFRGEGEIEWREGLDLIPDRRDDEFRGSLLELQADTSYEIDIIIEDPDITTESLPPLRITSRTWQEDVPVAEVRRLPAGTHKEQLVIETRGRPDGWIVYAPPDGESVVYDVGDAYNSAVVIRNSAYVILENITARGGLYRGVHITNSHDVRVRRCEVTGWAQPTVLHPITGRYVVEGTEVTLGGRDGVHIGNFSRRVTVEDNFIHKPLGGANSWRFGHPGGTHAMLLGYNGSYHNVIRNNDMIGSEEIWWNDAIEGLGNQAVDGGPFRDTDVYGNMIAFANDNAFEFDGGQINVRFWGNRMAFCYRSISFSPCISGPGYAFRNLVTHQDSEHYMAGGAYKTGSLYGLDVGVNLIMHNTVFGPGSGGPPNRGYFEDERRGFRVVAHNNLNVPETQHVNAAAPQEHRLDSGFPVFMDAEGGDFRLAPDSPGINEGVRMPNVNDDYTGTAPDLGVFGYSPDEDGQFPRRRSGMKAAPRHAFLQGFDDEDISDDTVEILLTVPNTAGKRWVAHPSSPWIKCVPETGKTADEGQTVAIRLRPQGVPLGSRRGAVTFRTDKGYNLTVMLSCEIRRREPFRLLLEAENAEIKGAVVTGRDPQASGGAYVVIPDEIDGQRVRREQGRVTFRFDVPEDGEYYIFLRAMAPSPVGAHNSFFVKLDDEDLGFWKLGIGTDWSWWMRGYESMRGYYNEDNPVRLDHDPRAFNLSAGTHTLTLSNRQPNCKLDALLVTCQPLP